MKGELDDPLKKGHSFYQEREDVHKCSLVLEENQFVVFYSGEAHKPQCALGDSDDAFFRNPLLQKIVIKIAVSALKDWNPEIRFQVVN